MTRLELRYQLDGAPFASPVPQPLGDDASPRRRRFSRPSEHASPRDERHDADGAE